MDILQQALRVATKEVRPPAIRELIRMATPVLTRAGILLPMQVDIPVAIQLAQGGAQRRSWSLKTANPMQSTWLHMEGFREITQSRQVQ